MMRALAAAFCLVSGLAATAEGACRQALALGLDVSGSVDAGDYRLQLDGLANALSHPEVRGALLVMPSAPVELTVFEWSGPAFQRVIAPWQTIDSPQALDALVVRLNRTQRSVGDPATGLGSALRFGLAMLAERPECWARTLDMSGDGKSNSGPLPQSLSAALRHGVTVNGLVIGADAPSTGDRRMVEIGELASYYKAYVISGPNAFVETAIGFRDFEAAMVRKLKRELQGMIIGQTSEPRAERIVSLP